MFKIKKVFNLMLMLYILLFPLIPYSIKVKGISAGDCIFFAVVILYLMLIITDNKSRERFIKGIVDFFRDYVTLPMFLLFVLMVISIIYAVEKPLAFSESLRFLYYIILYFIVKYEVKNRKMLKNILKGYIAISSIISAYGILQYFTKIGLSDKFIYAQDNYSVSIRITSTLDNPNTLGAFLILAIFPALMLAIYSKEKGEKILYSLASALIFISIILTFSRNAWLAMFFGICFMVLFYNWKIIIFPALAGCLSLMVPAVKSRLGDFSQLTDDPRIKMWKTAIKMIKDHPIFGVGNGNYVSLYDEYVAKYPELMYYHNKRFPSHNSYLKVQSELGIFGITLFITILIGTIFKLKKFFNVCKDNFSKLFYRGFLISVISFLIMNVADNLFFVPKVTMYFWIMVAILDGIIYNNKCD